MKVLKTEKDMFFFQELRILIRSLFSWFCVFSILAFIFFFWRLKETSITVQFFEKIKNDLLPAGVSLIITSPLDAFFAQISITLFLAFLFSSPLLFLKFFNYLSPALYQQEKKLFWKVFLPCLLLFTSGCLFSYFLLIPPTFRILYSYALTMKTIPFFLVNNFINLVLGLVIVGGIIFLLPVLMVSLAKLGIVEKYFWQKNWRSALIIFLIFSAIFTPDGSGITMMILSLPLTILYFAGAKVSDFAR